jgi:hypothetical protein
LCLRGLVAIQKEQSKSPILPPNDGQFMVFARNIGRVGLAAGEVYLFHFGDGGTP